MIPHIRQNTNLLVKWYYQIQGGIFMEITYTKVGDYYLPDLTLSPEKENVTLGKYGRMRLTFLKEHQKVHYSLMLMNGTLRNHLHDVDEQATEILRQTTQSFAAADGCNEELKLNDQIKWVGLMNNYRHCAEEIIFKELIYV